MVSYEFGVLEKDGMGVLFASWECLHDCFPSSHSSALVVSSMAQWYWKDV